VFVGIFGYNPIFLDFCCIRRTGWTYA